MQLGDFLGTGLELHGPVHGVDYVDQRDGEQPRWKPDLLQHGEPHPFIQLLWANAADVARSTGDGAGSDTGGGPSGNGVTGTGTGGQPTFPNGQLSGISPQMWTDLQDAIRQSLGGLQGGETVGQIADSIVAYLRNTGRWTEAELAVVQQQADTFDSHGRGFREQANDNSNGRQFFYGQIWGKITEGLSAWLQSVAPPGTDKKTDPNAIDPTEAAILAALGHGAGGGGSAPVSSGPGGMLVPVSSGGGLPLLPIALLLGAGGLAFYYYKKNHAHGGEAHE